jgi:hypothetical protein
MKIGIFDFGAGASASKVFIGSLKFGRVGRTSMQEMPLSMRSRTNMVALSGSNASFATLKRSAMWRMSSRINRCRPVNVGFYDRPRAAPS